MEQPRWLEKAKQTYSFHRGKLLANDNWNSEKTAKALRRSKSSVCDDLMIARWCKTHEKQLERFKYAYQALAFIRDKQQESNLEEVQ